MLKVILVILGSVALQQIEGSNLGGAAYENNLHAISHLCPKYNCPEYVVKEKGEVRLSFNFSLVFVTTTHNRTKASAF